MGYTITRKLYIGFSIIKTHKLYIGFSIIITKINKIFFDGMYELLEYEEVVRTKIIKLILYIYFYLLVLHCLSIKQ